MSALVTAAELKTLLQQHNTRVLDASYNLPPSPTGIPGAQDFNIDDVADPIAPFAHTIPTEEIFAAKVSALGIGNDDLVVVYDRGGIAMAAARAWWMFRLFGHENVKILDGGLPAWLKAGNVVVKKGANLPAPALFTVKFRPELLKLNNQMLENVTAKKFSVIDARDSKRFQAGHIPGSASVPYASLLNPDNTLKPKGDLEKTIRAPQGSIACTCGSGVTACVVALALYQLGRRDAAVYDGSWTEWGADPATPKAQGA